MLKLTVFLRRLSAAPTTEWVLLFSALLPFFLISIYNQPVDDDFHNASRGLTYGFIQFQQALYHFWTGRFTGNLLYAWGYRIRDLGNWLLFIKLMPVVWLGSLIGAIYLALRAVVGSFSRSTTLRASLWGMVLLLYGFPLLPSAIYWFNGATIYTLSIVLSLLAIAATAKAVKATGTAAKVGWAVVAAVPFIALIGTNELFIGGIGLGLGLCWLVGSSRTRWLVVWLGTVSLVAAAFSVLAPGNFNRAAAGDVTVAFSVGRLVNILIKDVYITQAHLASWSTNALLWLVTIVVLPAAAQLNAQYNKAEPVEGYRRWLRYPHVLLLGLGAAVVFMLFVSLPTLWLSNDVPQRIWNYNYFVFLAGWFTLVQYLVALGQSRYFAIVDWPWPVAGGLKMLFFLLLLTAYNSPVNQAYVDLLFRAKPYSQAAQARYAMLAAARQQGQHTVTLPALVERQYQYPLTIFLHDLETPVNDIENLGLAKYFQLDSVRLAHLPRPVPRHLAEHWVQ